VFHLPDHAQGDVEQLYGSVVTMIDAVTVGEHDMIANLANASSVLYHMLPDVNWAGFYLLRDDELVLGPFHGKPACIRIALGRGVCGTAAQNRTTIVVQDVHAFEGHIACDAQSASEIVVPMMQDGALIGVLDVDSPIPSRFDETDRLYLEQIVHLLMSRCTT
jgi:L-methionine (R)-S-oxide reductase